MQQDNLNLVSVIIPTYNRAEHLRETINTVLNQTYKDLEIIVINDYSSDKTSEILNSFNIPNLYIINNKENLGAPASRNIGINSCNGSYIAFIDDDDLWYPKKIELQLNHLIQNPHIDCIFCEYKYILEGRSFNPDIIDYKSSLVKMILTRSLGSFSLPLIRKSCIDEIGLLDINFESCQDWDYWIRISQKFNIEKLSECLVERNIGNDQITANISKKIKGRKYLLNKHSSIISRYPSIENIHLNRLGSLNVLDDNYDTAREYFIKAFKIYPFSPKTIIHLMLSYISTKFHKLLINKYGIRRYETVSHYH